MMRNTCKRQLHHPGEDSLDGGRGREATGLGRLSRPCRGSSVNVCGAVCSSHVMKVSP